MSRNYRWRSAAVLPLLLTLFAFSIWIADDSDVDHAAIITSLDEESVAEGRAIYQESCAQCHGADGGSPPNPTAASFTGDTLKNGSDPYAMWQTLTEGYGQMLPQTWLSPRQRYQVIHYIREEFFKSSNPSQYTEITQAYLDSLPAPSGQMPEEERGQMEYGPAITYELESTRSSLIFSLSGSVHLYYDLHRMAVPAVWTGEGVQLDATHHTEYKGGQRGRIAGERLGVGPLEWAYNGSFEDPRDGTEVHGPMPKRAVQFRGHYFHDEQTVLSYSVSGRGVLDLPGAAGGANLPVATHTLRIGPGETELLLGVGRRPRVSVSGRYGLSDASMSAVEGPAADHLLIAGTDTLAAAAVAGDAEGLTWSVDSDGRLLLHVPPGPESRLIKLFRTAGSDRRQLAEELGAVVASESSIQDPKTLTDGGPRRWDETVTTSGTVADAPRAYVKDDLQVPMENPWHSWMRLSGLDFFEDGRAAVSTLNGDVWIVSGIDDDLDELHWRRFATGLYEPLSLKVIDGQVYVVGRDRITRLHDENANGEADFYESFHAFDHVSNGYHAFTFGADTDRAGNLYVVKSGRKTDYSIPGAALRISPDGMSSEVVATGFRHPNGMTVGPDDRLFVSDNQGGWIPASKVSYVRPGGFYGYPGWEEKEVRRDTFDQPVFWLPHDVDDSSGGQAWASDERWGPLAGSMIHTSYGAGRVFYVLMQEMDGELQAAVVPFPWEFDSGTMRARLNPADGQIYVIGQKGWGTKPNVTADGGFYRIRYTGRSTYLLTEADVTRDGIALSYSVPLDPAVARDTSRFTIKRWNYKWTDNYGSLHYLPGHSDQEGEERVTIQDIQLSDEGHTVELSLSEHVPVDQMKVAFQLKAADGTPIEQTAYWTIKHIPGRERSNLQR